MRITAGSMRGRIIQVPDVPGLRPTPSKVRQALFNILGSVDGFLVLDLFAGSGIMALEALSRGAASATSIEQDHHAVHALKQSRDILKVSDSWKIYPASVEKGLAALAGAHFELIFADPPYAQGYAEQLPHLLTQHAIDCGQLVIEESARIQPGWPDGWICRQSRRYGDSCLHFLLKATVS
ncbi:MAG: 16S rRNA (guanine(966)-N(2))-methyltransferase RsmD [Mariprofundus sp.]|nr:16S rRNA (guanine(966)-N(2))-methyltransferase RsmD [Mariprofundus sp.]